MNPVHRRASATLLAVLFVFLWSGSSAALADGSLDELYRQAAANPIRTDEDRSADAVRKPVEFLQFAEVRPGMRMLDIAAGAGYTTRLLAIVAGSKGRVWAQSARPSAAFAERLAEHPQPDIVSVTRPFEDPVPNEAKNLDLITIIMNYHDIAYLPVDRAKMDGRLFDALKAGGHLVVIDHSAAKGRGTKDAKRLHRIEETVVLDEFRKAGFRLEQESDFLRNPADPRKRAFFDMDMPTDKFALRFVKP